MGPLGTTLDHVLHHVASRCMGCYVCAVAPCQREAHLFRVHPTTSPGTLFVPIQFRLLTGPSAVQVVPVCGTCPTLRHCAIVHSTCPVPRLLEELEAVKLAEAEQGKRDSLQAWYRKRFRAVRQCLPPPECWIQYRCRLIQIFGSLDHYVNYVCFRLTAVETLSLIL